LTVISGYLSLVQVNFNVLYQTDKPVDTSSVPCIDFWIKRLFGLSRTSRWSYP